MVKTRIQKKSNYKAIFINGKTLRLKIDNKKPMSKLEYPEFYDVKITNKCYGNCSYCYQDSSKDNRHYDILDNINSFFGSMNTNQRPFQVAIGGGEPTLHPDFYKCLKTFSNLGIMPNYTTNGMKVTDNLIKETKKYCGGVAVTMHKHIKPDLKKFIDSDINLNLHIMISDEQSVDRFLSLYKKYTGKIKYFVLLPIVNHGRAKNYKIDDKYLFKKLDEFEHTKDVVFGAMFHPYLKENKFQGLSLYDPEMFSKYLDMGTMKLHNSSFDMGTYE